MTDRATAVRHFYFFLGLLVVVIGAVYLESCVGSELGQFPWRGSTP